MKTTRLPRAIPAAAVAAMAAAARPSLATTTTIYDSAGFESPAFTAAALTGQGGGVWVESGGAAAQGTATVRAAAADTGGQGVTLIRADTAADGGDKRYWPNAAPVTPTAAQNLVTVSWDMDVPRNSAGPTGPFFGIESYAPGDALIAAAGVDAATGEVLFEDPTRGGAFNSTTADDTISPGAWHHFQLAMNFTTDTATVSVDGSVRQTVASFLSPNVTAFADADLSALTTAAETTTAQTGSAQFDNYSVVLGPSGPAAVSVATGQNYHFTVNPNTGLLVRTVGGLTVAAGGTATADVATAAANRQLLVVGGTGLTLAGSAGAWTGRLDLGNNDMDVPGGSLATVTNQVAQGFNGGAWNGSGGITSSAAASDPAHLTAVGVIQNVAADGVTPLYPSFDGQPVGPADVLVRLTLYGDTNLDGVVNAADYLRVDAGYVGHLTGWANGDFNYDGVVDGSDYTLMDNAFNQQTGGIGSPSAELARAASELSGGTVAAVPEPASVAAITLGVTGLVARRRSRRRP